MKTKHILAVLSTCLVAVSFSPINFFSQAAPPPGFTMFDGKEFQFDCTSLDTGVWHTAFTCPPAGNIKITDARCMWADPQYPTSFDDNGDILIKVTRASSSQVTYIRYTGWGYYFERTPESIILSDGDTVEYSLTDTNYSTMGSASIVGVID